MAMLDFCRNLCRISIISSIVFFTITLMIKKNKIRGSEIGRKQIWSSSQLDIFSERFLNKSSYISACYPLKELMEDVKCLEINATVFYRQEISERMYLDLRFINFLQTKINITYCTLYIFYHIL